MSKNKTNYPVELFTKMVWIKTGNAEYPYANETSGYSELLIRINDFPEEPLYTLLKDRVALCSFDDWPSEWEKPL